MKINKINNFLDKPLHKFLIWCLFGFIISIVGIFNVKAEEVYNRGAEFNYCNEYTDKCYITNVRYNDNAYVTLIGPYNAVAYNQGKFEYLAGIRFWSEIDGRQNDIISLFYTLTLSGLKEQETYSNDWLNSKSSYYSSSNVTILNAKLISNTYKEDSNPTNIEGNSVYLGTQTIKFKVNVQLNQDFNESSLYVGFGTYSTSDGLSSKLVYQHIANVVTLYADNYYSVDNSSTLINQNDTIISQNEQTNEELGNINDNITNDNTSEATSEASDFFSSFSTETFGLTSIITAPLNLIQSLTSSTCTSLHIPLPYLDNKYIDLPCMSSIYQSTFGSFFSMYQTITFGIIAYWVCVRVFNQVKDFKNPEHDEIEVLDL